VAEQLVAHIWLRGIQRAAVMADVLRGVEHTECLASQLFEDMAIQYIYIYVHILYIQRLDFYLYVVRSAEISVSYIN
jgi:hypothetical protein